MRPRDEQVVKAKWNRPVAVKGDHRQLLYLLDAHAMLFYQFLHQIGFGQHRAQLLSNPSDKHHSLVQCRRRQHLSVAAFPPTTTSPVPPALIPIHTVWHTVD